MTDYVSSSGKIFNIEEMPQPHLVNAMKKNLRKAIDRKMKHLASAVILNPLIILYSQSLEKYSGLDLRNIKIEMIRRGKEQEYNETLDKDEILFTSLALTTREAFYTSLLTKVNACMILTKSLEIAKKETEDYI